MPGDDPPEKSFLERSRPTTRRLKANLASPFHLDINQPQITQIFTKSSHQESRETHSPIKPHPPPKLSVLTRG
jgi:hypothetical protein